MYTLSIDKSTELYMFIIKIASIVTFLLFIIGLLVVIDGKVGVFGSVVLILVSVGFSLGLLTLIGALLYKTVGRELVPSKQIAIHDGVVHLPFLLFFGLGRINTDRADFLVVEVTRETLYLSFVYSKFVRFKLNFALEDKTNTVLKHLTDDLSNHIRITVVNSDGEDSK